MTRAIIGRGIVKLVQGDTALVEVENLDACSNCGAGIICHQGAQRQGMVSARNSIHATVDQKVALTESNGILLKLSLIQYGIPLVGFLLGVFIPSIFNLSVPFIASEFVLFCFGTLGLCLGGAISWKWMVQASKIYTDFFEISTIYSEV